MNETFIFYEDPKNWVASEALKKEAIEATKRLKDKGEAKRLREKIENAEKSNEEH